MQVTSFKDNLVFQPSELPLVIPPLPWVTPTQGVNFFSTGMLQVINSPINRHLEFAAEDNFKFCRSFKNNKQGLIFHDNCLLADNFHEISYQLFLQKLGKMSQNLSSAAVVIGALRVKSVQ